MGILNRIFPRIERASFPYSLDQFAKDATQFGYGYSTNGRATNSEAAEQDFDYMANRFYKGSAVVFGVAQTRMRAFSQITFKWRPVDAVNVSYSLFGTPELAILEHPWPGGRTGDLLARAIQDVDIAGNFYCLREIGSDGQPRLRRLRPDWVDIVLSADPKYAVASDVIGYRYYPGGGGSYADYTVEEVCHWAPIPDPVAQYRGMSWLTSCLNDMMVDEHVNKHKASFFKRGAVLNLAVMMKPGLTKAQFDEARQAFLAAHSGSDNAYRPMFIGGGSDLKIIEADLSKMDLKGISGTAETHIAVAAGTHSAVVGLSEGMQGASLNAGNYAVAARGFGNGTMSWLWGSFCDALESIVVLPARTKRRGPARLWYSDADVAILNDDRIERADIQAKQASMMVTLKREGYTPDSIKEYAITGNPDVLVDGGYVSVQLYKPGEVPDDSAKPSVSTNQDKAVVKEPSEGSKANE